MNNFFVYAYPEADLHRKINSFLITNWINYFFNRSQKKKYKKES